jgi:hypothetical protein
VVETYLLFCADVATQSEKMPRVNSVVPVNCDSMGEAINAACMLITDGVTVVKMKGPHGFMMERRDIETECLRRQGGEVKRGLDGAARSSQAQPKPSPL